MPKSKKKKNADFQKVKLKVGRRLPKGDNDTNISFKSRAIHITQHIKDTTNLSEPHTKRKQVLQDLLPLCEHYNAHVRLSGIQGILELITQSPENVLKEIGQIISKISSLLNDKDPLVRRAVLKLFKMIFSYLDSRQISSFFKFLSAHLCCAMTHICDDVQQDSLELFDLMLEMYPSLVIGEMSQLVTIFVEQISTEVKTGKEAKAVRTLKVNPSSKLSSNKWRIKVLGRLKKLVDAFLEKLRCENDQTLCKGLTNHVIHVQNYPKTRGPLVVPWVRRRWMQPSLSILSLLSPDSDKNEYLDMINYESNLQKFCESLLPLLKQCWIEDCPSSSDHASQREGMKDQQVTEQAVPMLINVVGVLHSLIQLWNNLILRHQIHFSKDAWFWSVFFKEMKQLLMPKFPIVVSETIKHKKGGQEYRSSSIQTSVQKLNLTVCDIMAFFSSTANGKSAVKSTETAEWQEKIMAFLQGTIDQYNGAELIGMAANVLHKVFFSFPPSKMQEKLVKNIYIQYSKAHPMSAEKKVYLTLFESLAFDDRSPFLNRLELFEKFFQSLPDLLQRLPTDFKPVLELVIRILNRGGKQNCKPLIDILRQNVEKLFDPEKGLLTNADASIQRLGVEMVHWIYYLSPPSDEHLKLFAQNIRLPHIEVKFATYLLDVLDNVFRSLQHNEAVMLKPHQPRLMSFLVGIITGNTKEEVEELQSDFPPKHPDLMGIVWTCDSDSFTRHAQLVECCMITFRYYMSPLLLFNVMMNVWANKVISSYSTMSIYMVYGILKHWSEMLKHLPIPWDVLHIDVEIASGQSEIASRQSETDQLHVAREAVEILERDLGTVAKLCFSLIFDIIALETADEVTMVPSLKVVDLMFQTVLQLTSQSLRILVRTFQLMVEFVTYHGTEKEMVAVLMGMTRLLQAAALANTWSKDRGSVCNQLDTMTEFTLNHFPAVSTQQYWHDFTYAVKIHKQLVQDAPHLH